MEYADVRVRLLPPSEQGRSTPILMRGTTAASYKPHLRVSGGEYLGVAFVDGPDWLQPGEEADGTVVLLYVDTGADYAALALSAAHEGTIHLVVSDTVMPGLGGVEVVHRLREQRPAIRTLLMSGYSDDGIVRRGILSSDMPFLQKPFSLDALTRAVRTALDAGRPSASDV